MRYKNEPEKNRVLNGWSHNPWKTHAGNTDDPDQLATRIADHYIARISQVLREEFHVHPFIGFEVNFMLQGADPLAFLHYVADETSAARQRIGLPPLPNPMVHGQIHREALQKIRPEARVKATSTQAYGFSQASDMAITRFSPNEEMKKAQARAGKLSNDEIYLAFCNLARFLRHRSPASEQDMFGMALIQQLVTKRRWPALRRIHPEAFQHVEQMLMPKPPSYDERSLGVIARVYEDGLATSLDHGTPEICTPPRAPELAVRQVNSLKRLLLESTYRFHGKTTSPLAARVREKFGDIDVEFLDPHAYFNLPEHLNFSLEMHDKVKGEGVSREQWNLMNEPFFRLLYAEAFRHFLGNDRHLSIGNVFPYQETQQLGEHTVHVSHEKGMNRTENRVEIRNFHDATSNASLSVLAVLSVALITHASYIELMQHRKVSNDPKPVAIAEVLELMGSFVAPAPLTSHPIGRQQMMQQSIVTRAMLSTAANLDQAVMEADMDEIAKDAYALIDASHAREKLLLKQPWGGKIRAEREAANGWKIGTPARPR